VSWLPRWRNGEPIEPEPPIDLSAIPPPYGPDPIVFGDQPRVKGWTWDL